MFRLLPLLLLASLASWAQNVGYPQITQYFDGNDTVPETTLLVKIDSLTDPVRVWQIGPPQKALFDTASTLPNVLVTDTINPYPTNCSSWFELGFPQDFQNVLANYNGNILAVQWNQMLDLDTMGDRALLEFSMDSGVNWVNAFDNPYVYNFYGYHPDNTIGWGTDTVAFTGTDTVWRNIWLCFDSWYIYEMGPENFRIRYRLVSDSTESSQDGWMIDNLWVANTWVHTINEEKQLDYLKVYPNPNTDGRVHIQAKKMDTFHIIEQLEVVNVAGQVVQQFSHVPTKFFVDLDDQPDGTYLIRVKTNIKTETFKIVLQKNR